MYLDNREKWETIKDHVAQGLRSIFPIEGRKGKISLEKIEIVFKESNLGAQKTALLRGDTLATPVYTTLKLSRGMHTETSRIKILDLPIITDRGTFVVLGKDYSVSNQMRLKPGIYVRKTSDSDDAFASFNLGKGLGFKLLMDSDGIFFVRFDKSKADVGTPRIPMYSLVSALGASDSDVALKLGKTLFESNKAKAHLSEDIKKIVNACVYEAKRTGDDAKDIKDYFSGTELSEATTKVTLGTGYKSVTYQSILDAAAKVAKVYANVEQEDDLDSLLFKEVLGVEDHLFLRIQKKSQEEGLIFKIKNKIDEGAPLKNCIPSNMFSKLLEGFFTKSSLASPQSEINPIEILETNHKLTAMGEGGIKSDKGIPMSARNLHPSHFGFIDPVRTTESTRVGVDLRMTANSSVKGRNIYTEFTDKSGKTVKLRPLDLVGKTIGFPDKNTGSKVRALVSGEMKEVDKSSVDYWMKNPRDMFTYTTNLVPFMHSASGNRITMAGRMITQAIPLIHREAPLTQIKDPTGKYKSLQEQYGTEYFSPKAPEDGKVAEVTDDFIRVNNTKVGIYTNFPLNLKTFITMYPKVKVGDSVKKGQILADSNYTKNGQLALGTNMNVAYLAYKGINHEDGIVVSESAVKKLTSQHMYIKEFEANDVSFIDKASFTKWYPTKITSENIQKLDSQGVIKKGVTVKRGEIIICALTRKDPTKHDMMLKKLRGGLVNPYKDASEYWDHDSPGLVTDIVHNGNVVRVVLTTEDEAKIGDKVTGLHGNKGTIAQILPDHEMPYTESGKTADMLLNPASVISRINSSQLYEVMGAKIAEKTGKPYLVENFDGADTSKKVLAEMKTHKIEPSENMIDPKTKESLGKVFFGPSYMLKLHKQTEGNFAARYRGSHDVNLQPVKGGEDGAKSIGLLDVYALLGHNARENLKEMATVKSEKNDDFWNRLEAGIPPAPVNESFAFNKFKSIVTASGINVNKENKAYSIAPLSDKHVAAQSSGAIHSSGILENYMGKERPESGGLFDPMITGGTEGTNWNHIELESPIVNPLFESVVKSLIHKDPTTMSGAQVQSELKQINVPKRIADIKKSLESSKGSERNKLLKELKYLVALKKMNMKPEEYVLKKFPVIPPKFRPIIPASPGGLPLVSDVNYLYKDMLNVNNKLKDMRNFPDSEKDKLIKDLRQSAHAIVGLMKPVNKQNEKRDVTGFLPQLTGSNAAGDGTSKESFFHRKLMKRTQNLTGRGTILPDPDLHIDEAKIPKDMAWELYKPFVIASLTKRGMPIVKARDEVKRKSPLATDMLNKELETRPIILNRAPTLHKFNMLAFKPIAVEGKSISIPPLIIKGFGADFDGDSVSGDTYVVVKNTQGVIALKQIRDVN